MIVKLFVGTTVCQTYLNRFNYLVLIVLWITLNSDIGLHKQEKRTPRVETN
jgi:hypothetical protein